MLAKRFQYTALLLSALAFAGCKDDDYAIPEPKSELQNDVLKRSLGPNLAGMNIEFAYAMALPANKGKLVSAVVEASITGAPETFLEHRSFYTSGSGSDVGVVVGTPSVNKDNTTTVTFSKDTSAATLRYYYRVPAEAKGQSVKFTFRAESSNGEKVSYSMGPYPVSKMDYKLDLKPVDGAACYISVEDMTVYTAAQAAANPGKIDLVYVYRSQALPYNHSLVSPGADAQYLPGVTLPAGVNRVSKVMKTLNLADQQLARKQFGVFVDDVDFQKVSFDAASSYALNLKEDAGLWVETADGKYRAYIVVNSVNNGGKTATFSMKRYPLQ
ncbi:DUF4466 family protein [Chitinophaga lutea]